MGFLARILESVGVAKHTEGEYREGPYFLPESGGWLPAGSAWNFWQLGQDVQSGWGRSAMLEACVSAYAQTVAMCPGNHWQWAEKEGRKRITTSALTRFLRKPNAYQSISDFLLNATRDLLKNGNTFALALRNDRYEITEMHLMDADSSSAQIAADGSVFYNLSGNEVIERMIGKKLVVPARDVLHIRMHTPEHRLVGESPLVAAALQMAAGNAALRQQVQFYSNAARPSWLLSTEQVLSMEQVTQLRAKWNEQAAGMNQGGVPILTAGLKAEKVGATAEESELIELLKLSDQAVAAVYRIPLQVLGIGETPYASTEALMQSWRAGGLGFILNHVEEAFGLLFKLGGQPDEYLEFDTSALLRSAFKDRVEAWAAGTKGGIFARDEARIDFELAPVKGGDEPWVQQQDIPLSVAAENAKNPPEPTPALPAPPEGEPPDAERAYADHTRTIDSLVARYTSQSVH
jgi:HK97 family phage portal protein